MGRAHWLQQMFENKKYFIFDLDQTLYPKASNIIKQIDRRIGAYCALLMDIPFEEGCRIGWKMNEDFGSTLGGLKREYKVDAEGYLHYVHDVDYSELFICDKLKKAISALDGRRYIYTNGTKRHAKNVLEKRDLHHYFDDIYGIEEADHAAKPCPDAFRAFLNHYNIDPQYAVFFDDNIKNIQTAENLGMTAFHVLEGEPAEEGCTSIRNLSEFLLSKIKTLS